MKKIVINENNLKPEDIDMVVTRVKALIVNSKGEILLAHNNHTYQFPGGHTEGDETLEACLKREIKEEVGIDVKLNNTPFLQITTFDNNYFNSNKKVESKIYYYKVDTDQEPNIDETRYDELELETDFNLYYIELSNFHSFLLKAIEDGSIDSQIGMETLLVLDEYNEVYGGNL